MMANAALLAALTTFLLAGWLAGELTFLVPYKTAIFRNHGLHIGLAALLVFLNLSSASTWWDGGCSFGSRVGS